MAGSIAPYYPSLKRKRDTREYDDDRSLASKRSRPDQSMDEDRQARGSKASNAKGMMNSKSSYGSKSQTHGQGKGAAHKGHGKQKNGTTTKKSHTWEKPGQFCKK